MNLRILLLLSLLFSSPALTEPFCKFLYYETQSQPETRICSRIQLSQQEIDYVHSWSQKVIPSYISFLKKKGIDSSKSDSIRHFNVGILSFHEINSKIMPIAGREIVAVGRYYPGHDMVYVTYESIVGNELVLAHELAHRINDIIGIRNKELDEKLAYDFENYLKAE